MMYVCFTARFVSCEKKCKAECQGTEKPRTCLFDQGHFVVWGEIGE